MASYLNCDQIYGFSERIINNGSYKKGNGNVCLNYQTESGTYSKSPFLQMPDPISNPSGIE
ncbi:hypothetical protein BCR32DRAFT_277286 [Anaeromyces robustus]|uniref:Uncharacterized protein n=1 Tax=Anaeromyces robustus TaxID=1754192 RepID=A0A1Y1XEU6_9FUNG|nr:hypothetical protein BCR32DRAFT_277286 [Anaeromyces robustus]|eukprot:ORX84301.1 hypothetical protein BCR32DRAFT_277286 [Anaeromyces robustus]